MKRRAPLIRLPFSFIALLLIFTMVAGGVVASQAIDGMGWRAVDWTIPFWGFAVLAVAFVLWFTGLVGWLGDEELTRLQHDKLERKALKKVRLPRVRNWISIPLVIAFLFVELNWGLDNDEFLVMNARLPNGASGGTVLGHPFGIFNIFNRTWTGVDLAIVVPLIVILVLFVRAGITSISRANSDNIFPPK